MNLDRLLNEPDTPSPAELRELVRFVLLAHLVELGDRWPTAASPSQLATDLAVGEISADEHVDEVVVRLLRSIEEGS